MGGGTLSVMKARLPREKGNSKMVGVFMVRDCKMGGLVLKSWKEAKLKVFELPQSWLALKDRLVAASRSRSEVLRGEYNKQQKSSFDDDLF